MMRWATVDQQRGDVVFVVPDEQLRAQVRDGLEKRRQKTE
jgi:hypothetical protein